jgi:hypothetical protein
MPASMYGLGEPLHHDRREGHWQHGNIFIGLIVTSILFRRLRSRVSEDWNIDTQSPYVFAPARGWACGRPDADAGWTTTKTVLKLVLSIPPFSSVCSMMLNPFGLYFICRIAVQDCCGWCQIHDNCLIYPCVLHATYNQLCPCNWGRKWSCVAVRVTNSEEIEMQRWNNICSLKSEKYIDEACRRLRPSLDHHRRRQCWNPGTFHARLHVLLRWSFLDILMCSWHMLATSTNWLICILSWHAIDQN